MAETTTNSGNVVTKFLADFFKEYVRESRFARYTGTGANNVITIKEGRQVISIPLVTRLKGTGVTGDAALDGNEEALSNYAWTVTPTYRRNAVRLSKEEKEKPNIDLMKAARDCLMTWAKEVQRDDIIEAMGAIYNGTTYANLGDATAGQLDTWNTNNQDRILYGAAKSNLSAGDHTTSLGTIDTTNDKLDTGILTLAKRMAQQADAHIRPIKTREDEEMYIMFADPYAFRDLKEDSTFTQAQREARERGKNNPLFAGGDLLYDNVIIREIPEIADFIDGTSGTNGVWGGNATADGLNTAGNSSTRVGVCFLCGAQAVSYGLGQRPDMIVDRDKDFAFRPGVAVEMKHDIKKTFFNDKQHGMVTVFVSAARDS